MKLVLILLAALTVLLALLLARAAARFSGLVQGLESRLVSARPQAHPDRLPERVRNFALSGDAAPGDLALRVDLTQSAEMQTKPGSRWILLEAHQTNAVGNIGFVWEARQELGPFTRVRVVDSLVGGRGLLKVQVLGLIPVVRAAGPDIDRAEAMRYLAELPWMPDAILGNPDIAWRMDGADWAEVSTDMPGGPVSVRFRFDTSGDIVEFAAAGRPATDPEGNPGRYDWRGFYRNYRRIGPRRIPSEGEVGYIVDGVYRPYFQCRVTGCDTEH